jgi:NTE family protein
VVTAYVLTGGGSLGAVQVGMLQALGERGIEPDLLIGTSAGAINAAFVAGHGTSREALGELAEIWTSLRRRTIFPLDPLRHAMAFAGMGQSLCSSAGLQSLLERHLPFPNLEDATIPVHVEVTNLLSGEEVLLSSGHTVSAVLASAAIPGVFPPVSREGLSLIDGGFADNAALAHAISLGADDVYVLPAGSACALNRPPSSALAVAMQALSVLIAQRLTLEVGHHSSKASIKVLPPLCPLSVSAVDFDQAGDLIDRARHTTGQWIDSGATELSHAERFLSLHHHVGLGGGLKTSDPREASGDSEGRS